MSCSGTFANNNTLIRPVGGTLSLGEANRAVSSTSGSWGVPTTLAATSGKWYIEYYVNSGSSGRNVMVVPTNSIKYQQSNYNFPVADDYGVILNSDSNSIVNDLRILILNQCSELMPTSISCDTLATSFLNRIFEPAASWLASLPAEPASTVRDIIQPVQTSQQAQT